MELEFHQLTMRYSGLRISLPGYESRLMVSLAAEGQLHPVLVVGETEGNSASGYVLIDGYRRVKALERLGRDTVEGVVLPLTEPAALMFRHCQESAHPRTALEDGWLIRELIELHGMSQAELSRRLQRSESWVSRRLSLVRTLPGAAQDLVRQGALCAHGAMKYLVPLARAKRSACKELVGHLSGRRTSAREMEQIYLSWKRGDAEQRRLVVSNPKLFLKAAEGLENEVSKERQGGDEIQNVSNDMEILDAVSGRARRRIRGMGMPMPARVIESWRMAQSSFSALTETMEKRIDAG
jgi:ParB family chromosome partitioning protein